MSREGRDVILKDAQREIGNNAYGVALGFAPQTAVVDRGYTPSQYGIPVSGSLEPSK